MAFVSIASGFPRTRSLSEALAPPITSPREPMRPNRGNDWAAAAAAAEDKNEDHQRRWRPVAESTKVVMGEEATKPCQQRLLSTRRLRPTRQPQELMPGVTGEILASGEVRMRFSITKRGGGQDLLEVMTVSADGDSVTVERRRRSDGALVRSASSARHADDLPPDLAKKYQLAARYVRCRREKTPKVTLHEPDVTCHLMENLPVGNFEARFVSPPGARVTLNATREVVAYEDGRHGETLSAAIVLLEDSSRPDLPLLARFRQLLHECRRIENALVQAGIRFPVVCGRRADQISSNTNSEYHDSSIYRPKLHLPRQSTEINEFCINTAPIIYIFGVSARY